MQTRQRSVKLYYILLCEDSSSKIAFVSALKFQIRRTLDLCACYSMYISNILVSPLAISSKKCFPCYPIALPLFYCQRLSSLAMWYAIMLHLKYGGKLWLIVCRVFYGSDLSQ